MRPAASVVVAGVVAFLGVLASYVALSLTGHDGAAKDLAPMVVTVLGVLGLGWHTERRTQEQNATIAKIDHQTNGVLTERIEKATKKAVADALSDTTTEH